jgi:probable addiction module antidote protein
MRGDYATFNVADYLDNADVIAEFLSAAAADKNPDVLLRAISETVKAIGVATVASRAGLGRESLYKTLAPGAHPRFETVSAILRAMNVRLALVPSKATPPPRKKIASKKAVRASA